MSKYQRYNAHDECEGRHQNRAQSQPCSFEHRFNRAATLVLQLLGELHDQDGVLARKCYQYQEADLRKDIDITMTGEHADESREQSHWHDQYNGKRQSQALVL